MKTIKVEQEIHIVGSVSGMKYHARAGAMLRIDERDAKDFEFEKKESELESLGLSSSVVKSLADAGIKTVDDILTHDDLTEISGIGEKTAELIIDATGI